MPEEQLGFFGEATPLDQLEPRAAPAGGGRGGSAAASKIPDKPEKYVDILRILNRYSQADFEIVAALPEPVHPGTVSKRRLRLERAGLVEVVPEVMRATPHGVDAMTFRITRKGKEVLAQWRTTVSTPPSSGRSLPPSPDLSTFPSSTPSATPPASGPSSSGDYIIPAGWWDT